MSDARRGVVGEEEQGATLAAAIPVNEVLTIGRQEIADQVMIKLQALCDQYENGVKVEQVVLQDLLQFVAQKGHMITRALLAKLAKVRQIFADLG